MVRGYFLQHKMDILSWSLRVFVQGNTYINPNSALEIIPTDWSNRAAVLLDPV